MNEQNPAARKSNAFLSSGTTDLSSLIKLFATSGENVNTNLTAQGLTKLSTYLTGQKLRYFAYRAAGFGHQANTVNMIKHMISLGFKNDIELIYDATDGTSVIDTLAVLLPGLDPNNPTTYILNSVPINFYAYTEKNVSGVMERSVPGLAGTAPICINGGAEITSITNQNLATALKVDYYLQVQPYLWETVNSSDNPKSLILPADASEYVDLLKQSSLSNLAFRAFGMQTPQAPNWQQLGQIPNINQGVIDRAKVVCDASVGSSGSTAAIMSLPMYGLYDGAFVRKAVTGSPSDMVFEMTSACALAQQSGKPFTMPVVISLLNQLTAETWNTLADYFPYKGENLVAADTADMEQEEKITYHIKRWCASNELYKNTDTVKGNIYICPDILAADLAALIKTLGPMDVVVIDLPTIPQDLFNYIFEIAGLPSIFEGQGTANLALNLAKPFFKLTKSDPTLNFPSDMGGVGIAELSTDLSLQTYNLIQIGAYDFKYPSDKKRPPELLAELMIAQANDYASNGPYRKYFDGLKAYFSAPANDKLLQSLVFLVTKYNLGVGVGNELHSLQILSQTALATDELTPLELLYEKIEGAISAGVLALIPTVIPKGPFADFVTAIINSTDFNIGSATSPVQVTFPAAHDKITIVGRTTDFLGTSLSVTVVFTMNPDGKTIDTAMTLEVGEVTFDGVQWFTLKSVVISSSVPGNDDRMTGNITTKIELDGNPLSFAADFPTSGDGKVLIDGDLSANPPSLNSVFQFFGGMNFMNTLPEQINSTGNIALKTVKFGYNYKSTSIETFQLSLINDKPWPLFGKLVLQDLSFDIAVLAPTGSRTISWTAKSSVLIGTDPDTDGSIDVSVTYPNLTVSALLPESGNVIPVGDLVTFFLPPEYSINLRANLAQFSMNVTPGEKGADTVYAVSAGLELESWDLSLGVATFSLTNIFVNVEGTGSDVIGTLAATTVLFSDQPDIAVTMNLTAAYAGKGAWSFSGAQGSNAIKVKQIIQTYLGSGWWVDGMPNMDISALVFNVESPPSGSEDKAKSYMVGGTIKIWDTPLGSDFESTITGTFGSGTGATTQYLSSIPPSRAEVPILNETGAIEPKSGQKMLVAVNDDTPTTYGKVSAEIIWNNINLVVFYDYAQGYASYGFMWGALSAKIDNKTNTATLKFTDSTSLGAMVETFISWLTGTKFGLASPWNLLDKITLSNFEIVWNFKTNAVKFSVGIGPIDLIFAKVTGFSIEYIPKGDNQGVHVSLEGSFLWLTGSNGLSAGEPLSWNAADPASTPTPSGGGNKYFDLRLLAAGQHVQVAGLQAVTTVQDAIKILETLPVPSGDTIPSIGFDAGNNWLFATDFGVLKIEPGTSGDTARVTATDSNSGYTFTLQVVFTDPTLYALRIALEGSAAKIFAGLDFQIIYRKLSEGLGVFSAEITLPTIMRRIDVGAVTITLPTFAADIYTNGDFKFDIGFPWNEDFTRSFSVEAIVPPGIPMLGSGGFYFGKLPAVAVSQLPVATNGFFNPNLVFGFGAQLGLGKSVDAGILKAGFSLTVFGILEGILAKWNPYDGTNTGGGGSLDLQGEYFFWIRGTFGIIGRLYGSVDFVIIKASVDINLKIYAQITLASYEPIPITVSAYVDVKAKAKINLGLFSISLSFSFSMHLKETFVMGALQNPSDAPWIVSPTQDTGRLLAPHAERQTKRLYALNASHVACVGAQQPQWNMLLASVEVTSLTAYLGYGLSIAGDDAFATTTPDIAKQFSTYIASLFIEAPGAADTDSYTLNAKRATGATSDTAFELLAKMVARWAVSSMQTTAMTPDQIDATYVDDATLSGLIDYLSDAENVPIPLNVADVESFMANQFVLNVSMPTTEGNVEGTYFPMPLPLNLNMPAYADNPNIDYQFGDYNTVSSDFVTFLREYFNQLAVQVEQEDSGNGVQSDAIFLNEAMSVAAFIFGDYFVLIMRQMLQALKDGLRDFNYPLTSGDTGNTIVTWVNATGNLTVLEQEFSLYDLFKGNEDAALSIGKNVSLPYMSYLMTGEDTFTTIAAKSIYGGAFDASALATNNASMSGLLVSGETIEYNQVAYTISGSETLGSLAAKVGVSLTDLLSGSDILTSTSILQASAVLVVPPYIHITVQGDTLQNLATANGITVQDLGGVGQNGTTSPIGTLNGDISDLFDMTARPYVDLVYLPQFQVGELIAESQRVGAINHLSGMASRYYFHGLRLPTEKITPNKEGMWVTKDGTGKLTLPDYAGLFALTGQQLPFTTLPLEPLQITLSTNGEISWLNFTGGANELVYTLTPPNGATPGDSDYQRIASLDGYAKKTILPAGPSTIESAAQVEDEPARYALSNGIDWQSQEPVVFPSGNNGNEKPRLWPLPSAMAAVAGSNAILSATSPNFIVQSVQMDEASGTVKDTTLNTIGWATSIDFIVKKVPATKDDSAAYKATYEISGTTADAVNTLERMVQMVSDNAAYATLAVGYQTASSSGGTNLVAEVGAKVTFGISQVNLSTVTQPPLNASSVMLMDTDQSGSVILNQPTEFVRLLWEASITGSGGFFLYFYNEDSGGGLPDSVFNEKGEATLTLVAMYQDQPRLEPYMNALVTGDPVDISSATVVAKAKSEAVSHDVQTGDTFASISDTYYSNLVSIINNTMVVSGNDITLVSSAEFKLDNGVYQVPVSGAAPGGALAQIAPYFNMTEDAIKAANPRVSDADWSVGLALGTAIRLPSVTRTIGIDPGGLTLGSMAQFYGTSPIVIAGHNADVTPLLEAGQTLSLTTGPLSQHGSQASGVQPIAATRAALPDIPLAPSDANYAQNFLLNNYTLLAYQVDKNTDFSASNVALPLGQRTDTAPDTVQKVRYVGEYSATDELEYATSIPYVQFAKGSSDPDSPYAGNGRLLQMLYNWNDLYGNLIVSDLDDQSTSSGMLNGAPSLTGYTDKLIGVAQWPSTTTSWTVADTSPVSDNFLLNITSSFDPTAFSPESDSTSDQWISRASSSLASLQVILAQINDPNGIAYDVNSSLAGLSIAVEASVIGTGVDYGKPGTLTGWWVPIETFLTARSKGDATAPVPTNLDFTFGVSALKSAVTSEQIFLLTLELTMTRTNGIAEGDFAAITEVKSIINIISTKTSVGNNADVLVDFAKDIETTLSVSGQYTLTVASGKNREDLSAGSASSTIWGVRLGVSGSGEGISYAINDAGKPEIFAPEPVCNTLLTKPATTYPYTALTDYDPATNTFTTKAVTNTYSNVDADTWVRQLFGFFDTFMSPQYTSSMLVIDAKSTNKPAGVTSYLKSFADQKEALANIAAKLLAPVYQGQTSTRLEGAQETFRQSLLSQLSNLYTTQSAISFGATVVADVTQFVDDLPPQLFGNLSWTTDDLGVQSLVSLTSPKMPLTTGTDQPITFLLQAPENLTVDGEVVQEISMSLAYKGASIEHQIASVPGIDGYVASSWLSPVKTGTQDQLSADLGTFTVPLLLRNFPATPRMNLQTGVATNPQTTVLKDITQWTYGYIYSLDFHYEQDRVYTEIKYNIEDVGDTSLMSFVDAFQSLAQFVTIQENLIDQINVTVPLVDATTTDQTTINNASLALGAVLKVVSDISSQAAQAGGFKLQADTSTLTSTDTFNFYIEESQKTFTVGQDSISAWVVTLTSTDGAEPVGLTGNPTVKIEGYSAEYIDTLSDPSKGLYAYYYQDVAGHLLQADVAQSIAARDVELPGIQILARQDALSNVHLTRNEDIGGAINEPFVFTTPAVSFGNPYHPTLTSYEVINIATLGSTPGNPVIRSLKAHLTELFKELFDNAFAGDSTIQLEVNYAWAFNADLIEMSVPLPVAVMPPLSVNVGGQGASQVSTEQMVQTVSDAITKWADEFEPSTQNAKLLFGLTIMSNLTIDPMPLLNLDALELEVRYISPAL